MHKINFTSEVETEYADQVERLFFFNANQNRHYGKIENICNELGIPKLDKSSTFLKFVVGESTGYQTLYVYDESNEGKVILGLLIYYRPGPELIEIIHIAVIEECSQNGRFKDEMILARMIERLRKDALRIKGIKKIKLPYNGIELDINKNILNPENDSN